MDTFWRVGHRTRRHGWKGISSVCGQKASRWFSPSASPFPHPPQVTFLRQPQHVTPQPAVPRPPFCPQNTSCPSPAPTSSQLHYTHHNPKIMAIIPPDPTQADPSIKAVPLPVSTPHTPSPQAGRAEGWHLGGLTAAPAPCPGRGLAPTTVTPETASHVQYSPFLFSCPETLQLGLDTPFPKEKQGHVTPDTTH